MDKTNSMVKAKGNMKSSKINNKIICKISFKIILLFVCIIPISCKKNYYLKGYFNKEQFIQQCRWKEPVKLDYKPDMAYLDSIGSIKDSVDVKLFLGTWCSDSRKYVSRFFSIYNKLPIRSLEIISVDTSKKDERGLFQKYKLTKIPCFVFEKNQNEIGRITEKPHRRKLEKEIYKILKKDL